MPIVKQRHRLGFSFDVKDADGKDLLTLAVDKGHLDIIGYLFRNGCKPVDNAVLFEQRVRALWPNSKLANYFRQEVELVN